MLNVAVGFSFVHPFASVFRLFCMRLCTIAYSFPNLLAHKSDDRSTYALLHWRVLYVSFDYLLFVQRSVQAHADTHIGVPA